MSIYTVLKSSEFSVGDRVVFVENEDAGYDIGSQNPLLDTPYFCEGTVTNTFDRNTHVRWDNGCVNEYEDYTLAKVDYRVLSIW